MNAISRRSFVRRGALAAAALAMPSSLLEAIESSGVPVRLGVASYTFREFSRAQMIGYLQQLHIADLNAKDVKDHLPANPALEAEAVAAYKAAGIRLHAAGAIYFTKNEDEDIRAKFDYCKRAGVGVVVAGDPSPESLPRVERFAKEYDMRIAIHNHGPEDKLWQSPLDILKLIDTLDPRIGCCIDVGHTVRAGTDVVDAIQRVGPRLFNVHMKDLTDFTSRESQVAVGEGKIPIKAIFEALRAIRYDGFVDLEYEVHGDNPMPGVTQSLDFMRAIDRSMERNG